MSNPAPVLDAARAVAAIVDDGAGRLDELVVSRFLLPELERISSLEHGRRYFSAVGDTLFAGYALQLADAKLKKILESFGCRKRDLARLSSGDLRKLLVDFASGARDTPSPEPKKAPPAAKSKAGGVKSAGLPDVRERYRAGGMEALYTAVQPLRVADLRKLVAQQQLKLSEKLGSKKDELLKQIQVAVKDELGPRGDWIGAIAHDAADGE